jgi:DNA-binding GntR family transcriptional regulator
MRFRQSVVTNSIQVANILRESILSGEFVPGAKLREVELSDSLSVSRTPIREAFRILESEGLLVVAPNKGVNVVSLSEDEIREIYEFRALIEVFAVGKACDVIADSDLKCLESSVKEMEEHMERGNYKEYLRCSTEFHLIYIRLCGNQRIIEVFKKIWNTILATQLLTKSNTKNRTEMLADHRGILSAIKARDRASAQSLIKDHISKGFQLARTCIQDSHTA